MNDQELHAHIETLVGEEHALFDRGNEMSPDDRRRLGEINVHPACPSGWPSL